VEDHLFSRELQSTVVDHMCADLFLDSTVFIGVFVFLFSVFIFYSFIFCLQNSPQSIQMHLFGLLEQFLCGRLYASRNSHTSSGLSSSIEFKF
jgi:membrane associated rhomboid family serine protease